MFGPHLPVRSLTRIAHSFAIAADVIVGSRLLLHTREAVYKRSAYDSYDLTLVQLSDLRVGASPRAVEFSADAHQARPWMTVHPANKSTGRVNRSRDVPRVRKNEEGDEILDIPSNVGKATLNYESEIEGEDFMDMSEA